MNTKPPVEVPAQIARAQDPASGPTVEHSNEAEILAAISSDPRLTLRAKGFAALLVFQDASAGTNMDVLSSGSRDGVETTRTAFRELKRYGYVEVERPRGDAGHLGSPRYKLTLPSDIAPPKVQSVTGQRNRHGTAGWVYAIASGSHIKIGRSYDPARRLSSLQSGSVEPLSLLWSEEGGAGLERFLHDRLASHRVHGEWFDLTHCDALILIARLAAEFGGAQ
ncbi:GIY-YIG nuclease family protein [Streptomyces sp. NPDC059916]|uniref:GIY-YIG nuclease family protein n=1 Tax=Streptomyces sp. NPDC059916 TaxID=3347001 RepID=UPI0036AF4C15